MKCKNRPGREILALVSVGFTLGALLLFYWVTPDIIEGIKAYSWPTTQGQLLDIGKGRWSPGGRLPQTPGHPLGRYSGGYIGVRILYHYSLPDGPEKRRPYNGWRYDAASSSKAFLALPGMAFPRPEWKGMHPGFPFTYSGIAHALPRIDSKLTVYYNPEDFSVSMLRPGIATDTAVLLVFLVSFLVLGALGWKRVLTNGRNQSVRQVFATRLGGNAASFAIVGAFLYVSSSYLLAVFFQQVIPSTAVLAYMILWPLLALMPLGRFARITWLQRVRDVVARVIVAGAILFTVWTILSGIWGWGIYKGDLVPGYVPSEETLLRILNGDDPDLYSWALYRLADHHLAPRHLPYYRDMLARKLEGLSEAALYGLKKLGSASIDAEDDIIKAIAGHEEAVYTLAEINSRPLNALPALIDLLESQIWHVRTKAIGLIGNLGGDVHDAAPALRRLLADPNFRVRAAAAGALSRIGDEQAITAIIGLLRDAEAGVRRSAAEALKHYGRAAREALPDLLALYDDEDQWVRKEAKEAVRWIKR